MRRATTPTHTFTFPFDYASYVDKILITYSQMGNIVLEKNENNVIFDGNTLSLTLTQEETNLFIEKVDAFIQVRVITKNDEALASDIYRVPVKEILNDEVL